LYSNYLVINDLSSDKWGKEASSSNLLVFVGFWAEWCGPCRIVSPIVEELSKEYENQVHFVKVNVDNNKSLATKYNVLSISTLLLLKNDPIIGQGWSKLKKDNQRMDR
jgi:thioredoxin 1